MSARVDLDTRCSSASWLGFTSESAKLDSSPASKSKSLEVAIKDLARELEPNNTKLALLSSLIQNMHESMMCIAQNMSLTREERKALEERKARLEKVERLAKSKKLDEIEAERAIELLLAEEDKKLLEEQCAAQDGEYA